MKKIDLEELYEVCDYINKYKSDIYVRDIINNKYESVSLTELPPDKAIEHTIRFIRTGRIPLRVVRK